MGYKFYALFKSLVYSIHRYLEVKIIKILGFLIYLSNEVKTQKDYYAMEWANQIEAPLEDPSIRHLRATGSCIEQVEHWV